MSFQYIQEIPSAESIREALPVPENLKKVKLARDKEIRNALDRTSDTFLLIIGPCSAHHEDAVCEYISRLAKLQEQVAGKYRYHSPHLHQQAPHNGRRLQGHGAPA